MKIILDALPSKIDYKEDYEAILKDVNDISEGKPPNYISVGHFYSK